MIIMKQTGICPKCQGRDIIRIEGSVKGYGAGNNIPVGITIFSYVKVPRYVCGTCGYSEEWIDKKDIHKIREKFG
jgi:ribosomal protein S27AE